MSNRYSDNANSGSSENNWSDYPGSRRTTNHSTGRSNYGGTRRSSTNNKKGNPIGNWIQNRAQDIRTRHRNRQRNQVGGAVGTEAKAIQNQRANAKDFKYPEEGFITPIEHSLLYAMIEFPENYPESVVRNEIEDEDFNQYLYVKEKEKKRGGIRDDGSEQYDVQTQTNNTQTTTQQSEEEKLVSYGQLSALLALSAAKNPSRASPEQTTEAESDNQTLSVGETLCRKLLRTITRYADAHSLDREHEIREFLDPIERRCAMRNEKAALQQLLPAYAGYTVSLLTGNPLPLLIGAAVLTGPDPMMEENTNVHGFRGLGSRTGDMETAGLLDENEFDDD